MMWKRSLKYYLGLPFVTKYEDIHKKLKATEVVSFDIFDTLVKRGVNTPVDVFQIVENTFNSKSQRKVENFKYKRITAEEKARRVSDLEEITIEDIYDNLEEDICDKRVLMDIEKMIEVEYCIPNEEIQEIYECVLRLGKKVIITSDMYLPEKIIKRILDKCGYQKYDNLYLSSTYMKTKSKGTIFSLIKEEFNNKKIIHIGDDFKADYIQAYRNGIKSILIDRKA